jgi:hypothetical protein
MNNIYKGNTLKLNYSNSDYSSSTYDIWIAFRGPSQIDIKDGESGVTIETSGTGWAITVTAATTELYTAGDYWYNIYMGKSSFSERYTAESGTIKILPNLSDVTETYDNRSHVKKTLDAIEAVIEGRATKDQMAYSIAGRSLSLTPIPELIQLRQVYKREYLTEQQVEKIARGEAPGTQIKVRF